MGDGRGDTQAVWHEHVGRLLDCATILDVGAGLGLSKARLANNGRNVVTTQDIDRSLMERVDYVKPLARVVSQKFDYVTAFDVVEHAWDPPALLDDMAFLTRRGVFFTTPAYALYPRPWHFTPQQVLDLAARVSAGRYQPTSMRLFARYKGGDYDRIEEVTTVQHLADETVYAHGIYLEWV